MNPSPTPTPPTQEPRTSVRVWTIISALSLILTIVIFAADRQGLLHKLDLQTFDLLVGAQHPAPPSENVLNVDFDESFVRRNNAFPIPRLLLAEVIRKIAAGKPAAIGIDVILDVPRAEADDVKLASEIEDAGNVILVSEYGFADHPRNEPLPIFKKAAAGVAFGDLVLDDDGAVRRMFLRVTTPDYKALSLPVALADYATDQHLRPGGRGFVFFGATKLPLASAQPDTAWISPYSSPPTRVVPVESVLSATSDSSIFNGKIVLVGQSSEMGKDLFATPNARGTPLIVEHSIVSGAAIHGAATATIVNKNFLRTVHSFPRFAMGFVLAFCVIAIAFHQRWYLAVALCLALIAIVAVSASLLFADHLWFPFVSIESCLVAALPAGLGYRSVEERRLKNAMEAERRQLMGLFERYVSPDVAAEIWKNRDQIVLAGEERVATILFSDIRNFTATTAGVPSKEVLAWLNRYLTAMGEVIKQNRGFLNKFIGDGIMVIFGAPLTEGAQEDACRAVRCAQEMLAAVDQWNATKAPTDPPLKIGIGIHTGQVTAGNVGSPDRLEYSVIGEAVNLASRLESLTKDFKTSLVLSPATWEQVHEEFPTVSLGKAQVRGFTTPIPLYSVKSSKDEPPSQTYGSPPAP